MNKKNQSSPKWIIATVLILMIVFLTNQHLQNKYQVMWPTASTFSSPGNFFEYLANLLGIGNQNKSSAIATKNNSLNQNNSSLKQISGMNGANLQNPDLFSAANSSGLQKSDINQGKNSVDNLAGINAEGNQETNPERNSEITTDNSAENNSGYNATGNAETNAETNLETNPDNNSGDTSESNPDNNPGTNAQTNSNNNSPTNTDNNSGDTFGGNSGNNSNGNSGGSTDNNSGGNSNNNSGGNSGNNNQPNLPTINPIPSNDTVSQNIAQQNQQNESTAALLATRQALVAPVEQQAQESKYQTVDTQNIPPVSTNQPPADVQAKINSHQYSFH